MYECLDCCEINKGREVWDLKCIRCQMKEKKKDGPRKISSHGLERKNTLGANGYVREDA